VTARNLHVSDTLSLPRDTVTASIIVYGGKGMGKTNFAGVLSEEVHASGLRFSLIDPMGVSWGLRHDASGKGRGIELLILGGIHGDIPIEPTGGEVVADLVADEDVCVLIDISRHPNGTMWSKSERVRFVTAYCKRLYMRQGEKRRPLLQIIDEAARFAPQTIRQGDTDAAACVGAVSDLMEEGRNVGVGLALFTQRSARLSKDVAELADMMVAFRTIGPNSMKAVLDWLGEYVEKERHKEISLELRKLPKGAALIVSPGWLEFEGIVQMRLRHTFDSSATPKPGQEHARASGPGAKPDLARYVERMKETIERAAAENPKALRAEIAKLKAELARKSAAVANAAPPKIERVEVPVVSPRVMNIVNRAAEVSRKTHSIVQAAIEALDSTVQDVVREVNAVKTAVADKPKAAPSRAPSVPARQALSAGSGAGEDMPPGERAIITCAAQYPDGVTREQLTVLTGYKKSARDTYIYRAREKGRVDVKGDRVIATQAGVDALGADFEPLPTGAALLEWWRARLGANNGERKVLDHLVDEWPREVPVDEIPGYAKSARDTYLYRLSNKRLVERGRGTAKAADLLFDGDRHV